MYRYIHPGSVQDLPLRMLYQPQGAGTFGRACEADGWRGLVAALSDDPSYEHADAETRLLQRLRLADDIGMLAELIGFARPMVADHDAKNAINVASDEPFIRSLQTLGFVSLEPAVA